MRYPLLALCWLLCGLLYGPFALADGKATLKAYPKLFSRVGEKLTVKLDGPKKQTRIFKSNSRLGENYLETKLINFFPSIRVALLQHFYNEGGDFTLLSLRTGEEIKVAEKPKWNKANDLFVSVNEGEFAGDKKGLQLGYCTKEKGCQLLLEKDGRYSLPKWRGNDNLQATLRVPNADGGEGQVLPVSCVFERAKKIASCQP